MSNPKTAQINSAQNKNEQTNIKEGNLFPNSEQVCCFALELLLEKKKYFLKFLMSIFTKFQRNIASMILGRNAEEII